MKNYYQLDFTTQNKVFGEILTAELMVLGYEGFVEKESEISTYIEEDLYNEEALNAVLSKYVGLIHLSPEGKKMVAPENWNATWEQNFQPIIVEDKIVVHSSFHQSEKKYPYTILIDPRMAFGTGHHETTWLMMKHMLSLDFEGKKVLDFGCGTGILAILADQLKAGSIVAIDIEEGAVENSAHNFKENHSSPDIQLMLGNDSAIPDEKFDIILANINKNVILQTLDKVSKLISPNGFLLYSGILKDDLEEVLSHIQQTELNIVDQEVKGNWSVIVTKA